MLPDSLKVWNLHGYAGAPGHSREEGVTNQIQVIAQRIESSPKNEGHTSAENNEPTGGN